MCYESRDPSRRTFAPRVSLADRPIARPSGMDGHGQPHRIDVSLGRRGVDTARDGGRFHETKRLGSDLERHVVDGARSALDHADEHRGGTVSATWLSAPLPEFWPV